MREHFAHRTSLGSLIDGTVSVAHRGQRLGRRTGDLEKLWCAWAREEKREERGLIKGVLIRSERRSMWPGDEEHWERSPSTKSRVK